MASNLLEASIVIVMNVLSLATVWKDALQKASSSLLCNYDSKPSRLYPTALDSRVSSGSLAGDTWVDCVGTIAAASCPLQALRNVTHNTRIVCSEQMNHLRGSNLSLKGYTDYPAAR